MRNRGGGMTTGVDKLGKSWALAVPWTAVASAFARFVRDCRVDWVAVQDSIPKESVSPTVSAFMAPTAALCFILLTSYIGRPPVTVTGVHPETSNREPPSTRRGESGWTSMKA
jgi:hypothetical protein